VGARRYISYSVCCVLLAIIGPSFLLWRVRLPPPDGHPLALGRAQGTEVYFHLGDVALPNQLRARPDDKRTFSLSTRILHWDVYMITAPVPRPLDTAEGKSISIPWTSLPVSTVKSIRNVDPNFANTLERRIGLKQSSADWNFERVDEIVVAQSSDYYKLCGIKRIYAVNMFDFMPDLGPDYRNVLRHAISDSVMEVVQRIGDSSDKGVAIPALAGAQYVVEKDLVLPYDETFGAILDGVTRVQGPKPSKVYLLVWRALAGSKEATAALRGLEKALYNNLPRWKQRLNTVVAIVIGISFAVGVVTSTRLEKPLRNLVNFIICGIAICVLVAGNLRVPSFMLP